MRIDDIADQFGDQVRIEWKSFMLRTEPKTSSREKFVNYTTSWQRCAETEPRARFTTPWQGADDGPTSSLPAQMAWKAASSFGPQAADAMKRMLMAAYFVDNRDISDRENLVDIAVSAGIDRDDFVSVLEAQGPALARAVVDEHNQALGNGVTAVPTVVIDGLFPVPGAQETETYVRMIERMLSRRSAH